MFTFGCHNSVKKSTKTPSNPFVRGAKLVFIERTTWVNLRYQPEQFVDWGCVEQRIE